MPTLDMNESSWHINEGFLSCSYFSFTTLKYYKMKNGQAKLAFEICHFFLLLAPAALQRWCKKLIEVVILW